VKNVSTISENMLKGLIQVLPVHKEILRQNFTLLQQELDSLDKEIDQLLSGLENRRFIIYHPALTYFARDYNLEQLPLELEGNQPSPAHMRELIDLGKRYGIPIIFVQREFDQDNAKVLAKETGASVVEIDPLSFNWRQQMLHIATQLSKTIE
jgi:zinc transport system substrate-binding protein